MKKIGFIAFGPASANSLLPLIQRLKNNYNVYLYAYHPYVANLWGCNLMNNLDYPTELKKLDLIVYGTGSNNEIEINIPIKANEWGVPTISILDCYWSSKENLYERFKSKPTYIIVPNQDCKKTVDEFNLIQKSNVKALGNPHFDRLHLVKQFPKEITYPLNIVFFSQCGGTGDFTDTHDLSKKALMDVVAYKKLFPKKVNRITVTPHPREDKVWLKNFCNKNDLLFVENKSMELLLSEDISVGVHCTLQYESEIIGKPTVFYKSQEMLYTSLNDVNKLKSVNVIDDFESTEKCISFIERLLLNTHAEVFH